ncbi:MAG: hypothetical protein D6B25_18550 [Desulfobulbaceae bacterium]|nr:MAG: hypothetical protein D6B25_18550 [Desulfobulbaceae bacterium]
MTKCRNHPDREARYQCSKYGYYLCDNCLNCNDPELYCKFRSSCVISYLDKESTTSQRKSETVDQTIIESGGQQ